MKILLSCFACAPNQGSEPGVGWNWAVNLAQYHDVCVLTRMQNKRVIEEYCKTNTINFQIEYFGINFFEKYTKFPFRENLYSMIWQRRVVRFAERLNKYYQFDLCHHITYASFKFPSRLYKLGIPLIIGPVGGGEVTPNSCYRQYDIKGRIKEFLHDEQIKFMKKRKSTYNMFSCAQKILVTTLETFNCVPQEFRSKCDVMQTIGIDEKEILQSKKIVFSKQEKFKILYVGMIKQWKGMKIIVDVARKLKNRFPNEYEITVIGRGPDEKTFRHWLKQADVSDIVRLIGGVSRTDVLNYMEQSHLFMFPSFHDSGAMVVLEAMAVKTPVIVLGAGGPAVNVHHDTGYVIDPNQGYDEIIDSFVNSIIEIRYNYCHDIDSIIALTDKATEKLLENYTWNKKAVKMNEIYREII